MTPKRSPSVSAVRIPDSAMPSTGLAVVSRASASPGSLKQAITNAAQSLSRARIIRASGWTTASTCACVSIPGGPSASVAHSIAGPPARRSGSIAASIPRVTTSLELGLMTRMRSLIARLLGAEQPVAGVAQPRDDVAVVVEVGVDRRGDDRHVGMRGVHLLDALGRGEQADVAQRLRAELLDAVDRGDRRVAGGEHRVEQDRLALRDVLGQLAVVLDRRERLGIAVETDMPDARRGERL